MSDYETLRQFADTVGLAAMAVVFVGLCAWPFLPGRKGVNRHMAESIFRGEDDGE
ncbi:cbb3-type cytochrome c oxidase subunit 3 [Croceicoccus sp. BE223]|uniref:cbb3-type cytochrome oxidase subunit 3 n=1 Tax=Croceicoccus sp. BE223 TaxID=2817716 RepID=UPI002858C256|nr:cbb3-type cytochrome c oxidase subunit 3 [Croceicoccus sp. BE223]MDR7101024.1 cytochrome c oxidase cbb3-type subunit 4 [Croceicoccus sp. BE223]